jgi:superkiller protein 3
MIQMRLSRAIGTTIGGVALLGLTLYSASYSRIWQTNLSLFTFASQTSPTSAYIQFNLGNSLYHEGRLSGAAAAYKLALAAEPGYSEARTNLGITLMDMGDYLEALTQLQWAERDGDHSATLFSNLAALLRKMGNVNAAIYNYQRALHVEPSTTIQSNLAECLMATNRWADAEILLRDALKHETRVELENNIGLVLLEQNRPREAIDHLQSALGLLGPDKGHLFMLVHFNLARAWNDAGETERAAAEARIVLGLITSPDMNEKLPKRQELFLHSLVGG